MNVKAQAAVEFLLTYGWAFLIMISVIAGFFLFDPLSYLSSSTPTCSNDDMFICEDERLQISPRGLIGFTFTNRGGKQLTIQQFNVTSIDANTESNITCETPVIFERGARNNVRCEGLQDVVEGEKSRVTYEAVVYETRLGGDYVNTLKGTASAPVIETDALQYLNKTDPSYFTFSTSSVEAVLSDYSSSGPSNIVMPDTFEGKPIVGIRSSAFETADVESINFPSTLVWIEQGAFRDKSLQDVTLPVGFKYIERDSFRNNNIESLSLPDSLEYIQQDGFRDNNIETVTLPNSVYLVNSRAFLRNDISSLTLSSYPGYTRLRPLVFRGNDMSSITIPSNIDRVDRRAFGEADITQAVLPADMTIDTSSSQEDELGTNGLASFYESNGKQPGTYTYDGSAWSIS